MSVIIPFVVPFATTLAPMTGSPLVSITKPVTVIACNCSVVPKDLPLAGWVAIALPLPKNSALIATAVRNLLYANPLFLRSSFIND